MGKISLLDCTLRDGGYVNDWRFGEGTIKGICKKIAQTGVEIIETGFIKGDVYDPDRSVFPETESIEHIIAPKDKDLTYVAMLDMSAPVPLERLTPRSEAGIDGIRVIFKKDKTEEAYTYCKRIKELGYMLFVNFVSTDLYTDEQFIKSIEKFNVLQPHAMTIVDTFGLIKRKQFLRFAYIADSHMAPGIALAYHAHNNLQLAFGNAEALAEMNLKRDICIDACIFGMGRGAGNLNLELFADFLNENYEKSYRIEPMLEIMDEYLFDIYRTKFWGYSLPLYLSAACGCHPNYAIYLAEKKSLAVKGFNELLKSIPDEDKVKFTKEKAEKYYREYQEKFIDDRDDLLRLSESLSGKKILLLAPGKSILKYSEKILDIVKKESPVIIAVNFTGKIVRPDYIFSSNMRRYSKIKDFKGAAIIATSNMKECTKYDYMMNFSSYASEKPEVTDNSGLMMLRLLVALGKKEAYVAGMDGYSSEYANDYADERLDSTFEENAATRNRIISEEINSIGRLINLQFITPTYYKTESPLQQDNTEK